ncbi:hypothetical protein J6590_105736 [Homalodisca vitripennis]|nr:hypothetical protein J6590_105736 [Homalodisca vitripennis]
MEQLDWQKRLLRKGINCKVDKLNHEQPTTMFHTGQVQNQSFGYNEFLHPACYYPVYKCATNCVQDQEGLIQVFCLQWSVTGPINSSVLIVPWENVLTFTHSSMAKDCKGWGCPILKIAVRREYRLQPEVPDRKSAYQKPYHGYGFDHIYCSSNKIIPTTLFCDGPFKFEEKTQSISLLPSYFFLSFSSELHFYNSVMYPGVSPSSALNLVLVAGELALVGGVSSEPHWVEVSAGHLPVYPGVSPSSALTLVLVAGELALVGGVSSEPHWVEVSAGHLPVYPGVSPSSALTLVLVAGELALVGGVSSEPHWVEVSAGHLPVYPGVSPSSALTLVLVAGELALVGGVSSEPHWVEVSAGHLLVYPGVSPSSAPVWRLPLRHLNLQPAASGRPRGFSLSRHGETVPIATFQCTVKSCIRALCTLHVPIVIAGVGLYWDRSLHPMRVSIALCWVRTNKSCCEDLTLLVWPDDVYQFLSRFPHRNESIGGSVVECSPATRAARVRFPADAWLGYLALTQEARVRFPVPEVNFCTS